MTRLTRARKNQAYKDVNFFIKFHHLALPPYQSYQLLYLPVANIIQAQCIMYVLEGMPNRHSHGTRGHFGQMRYGRVVFYRIPNLDPT